MYITISKAVYLFWSEFLYKDTVKPAGRDSSTHTM